MPIGVSPPSDAVLGRDHERTAYTFSLACRYRLEAEDGLLDPPAAVEHPPDHGMSRQSVKHRLALLTHENQPLHFLAKLDQFLLMASFSRHCSSLARRNACCSALTRSSNQLSSRWSAC